MSDSTDDLFALVPVTPAARDNVLALMDAPDRHYHGTAHLTELWQRHLVYGAGTPMSEPPWHR